MPRIHRQIVEGSTVDTWEVVRATAQGDAPDEGRPQFRFTATQSGWCHILDPGAVLCEGGALPPSLGEIRVVRLEERGWSISSPIDQHGNFFFPTWEEAVANARGFAFLPYPVSYWNSEEFLAEYGPDWVAHIRQKMADTDRALEAQCAEERKAP